MNGNKLRVFREFRNYSQEYVAEKIGITQNAYSKIETNQTKISTERLRQLADILKVPVAELLSDTEPEFQYNTGLQGETYWKELLTYCKQLYDQILHTKDEKIAVLEDEINSLRKDREKMLQLIEKLT